MSGMKGMSEAKFTEILKNLQDLTNDYCAKIRNIILHPSRNLPIFSDLQRARSGF